MSVKSHFLSLFVLAAASLIGPAVSPADEPTPGTIAVEIETTEGNFVVELNKVKAPKTVENFLRYAESGHYDGTVFHRVIKGFMIQGGGMDQELNEKETRPPVRNEAGNGLTNEKYTIAMARTSDPHSATSQFFVNTADNAPLNRDDPRSDGWGYAVFGKVVAGTEVIDKIENAKTRSVPNPQVPALLMRDVPASPITIKSVKVVKAAEN